MRTINHFVGGKEVAGNSGRFGDVFNPATGEVQAKVALASKAEVDAAVKVAAEAFPKWSATPPLIRARVMFRFKQLIEENMDAFANIVTSEHGKVLSDAKGSITNVAHWGKRTLSYAIKKKDTGYYVVAQFETAAELLPEYERAVKLEEGVVRFLVVVSEGLPAKPEPAPAVIAADVVVDEIEEDEA